MHTPHIWPALLGFIFCGCGDKDDDTADGSNQVSIDCETVSYAQRTWGGTTSACGPFYSVVVARDGTVTASSSTDPEDPSDECDLQAVVDNTGSDAAAGLLLTICEEFNACVYQEAEMTEGAFDATVLMGEYTWEELEAGTAEPLVTTAEVYCEAGLPSLAELKTLWENTLAAE